MKVKIIRYYLICIFLCVSSFTNAQSWINELKQADSLFNVGEYQDASIFYEYVVYSCNEKDIKNRAVFQKAVCLKQLKRFDKAFEGLQRIEYFNINDTLVFKYEYESALNAYLSSSFIESISHIEQTEAIITDTVLISPLYKIKALNYDELTQYNDSKNILIKVINSTYNGEKRDSLLKVTEQMFSKKHLPKIRKDKISKTIGFIPGVGAFYAGYYGEAALNIALNAAAFGFGVYEILNKYYITGYIFGFGLFSQLLVGGQSRAVYLLNKRNYLNKKIFNDKARSFINDL